MSLIKLIYASVPFGFDDAMLNGILADARRCNPRDDITGALVCRHDLYLQLLEGPRDAVEAAYARIAIDDRHVDVVRLYSAETHTRLFPAWAMRDDPARSWMWTPAEVAAGAAVRTPLSQVHAIFERIAAEAA